MTGTRTSVQRGDLLSGDASRGACIFKRTHGARCGAPTTTVATPSPRLRLNAICPYYTMFPLDFPLSRLARAPHSAWILDPFCGRGTTLFAARLLGLRCVGIDSNPIAAAVAAAKLTKASAEDVMEAAARILRRAKCGTEIPRGEFWRLCYHPSTLRDICAIREQLLRSCSTPADIVLRALMLGILHGPMQKGTQTYLSNQMPRTYATKPAAAVRFWKRMSMIVPPAVNMLTAISRRAQHALADTPPPVCGAVYFGDARQASSVLPGGRRFSWVVTSPPYFGLRTYRPDQWLRNWFLGGMPDVDYRENGQLSHHVGGFSDELGKVWRSVGSRCLPGARLVVRFGYLPSLPVDPREVLRDSLDRADVGWHAYRWADAGFSSNGKRQAQQFGRSSSAPAREVDMYARLEL